LGCYNNHIIITKKEPFTKGEIEQLREEFDMYIRVVIDISERICSAGQNPHFKSEKMEISMKSEDQEKKAEDALMYSTLF